MLVGVLIVLLAAALAASLVSVPYYALTPGAALNVSSLIGVPSSAAHRHRGAVLLTDVELVPLRAIDYFFYKWNAENTVLPSAQVTGPVTPTQYNEQGTIDMATARSAATIVALKTLGYPTTAVPNGVVDYQPEPGSPAASALAIGDVITAIDGAPTLAFAPLKAAIAAHRPGDRVTVRYHHLGSKTTKRVELALGEAVGSSAGSAASGCIAPDSHPKQTPLQSGGHTVACLGLYLEQLYAPSRAPFDISIDSAGIIGPSAGLAFTLGLLEKLDPADLTAGRTIAATGTMSITGAVGDVGGVAQKTIAVERAGASVFFVPPEEYSVAKAHATHSLRVIAVSSLSAAVRALERLGGRIEPLSTAARS